MKKYFIKTICFLLFCISTLAQTKDEIAYKTRSLEIQKDIWDDTDKAFDATHIPEKYNNESAIILAKSYESSTSRKKRHSFFWGNIKRDFKFTTHRERILLKDKASLEAFSKFRYTKIAQNIELNLVDIYKTFIGIKILKKSGKQEIINPNEEEILLKNETEEKVGIIAIPNLQVGDILDYYIRVEKIEDGAMEAEILEPFYIQSEYPILQYKLKFILQNKFGIDILNLNNAKPMVMSTNEEGDLILEITEKNIPKFNSAFWINRLRQVPYYVIRQGFENPTLIAKKGEVKTGPFIEIYKEKVKERFRGQIQRKELDFSILKTMEKFYGGKNNLKNLPIDTIVNWLYNFAHWSQYPTFWNKIDVSNQSNMKSMPWLNLAVTFSEYLRYYDIDNEIVLVCNRNSMRLNEIFGIYNLEAFVKANYEGKTVWLCFNDFFQNTGRLAADYEGEQSLVLKPDGKKYIDIMLKLPVSKSSDNVFAEKALISFEKSDLNLVKIIRKCTATGAMKQEKQKKMLLAEEVRSGFAVLIGKPTPRDYFNNGLKNKKDIEEGKEIMAALDNEKLKQKEYFKKEINENYDQAPKEFISYKINNDGLSLKNPAFEYTEVFTMENFIKKAGNNFILDVGKLIGLYRKVDNKERTRSVDVYMPCARTLVYNFDITIPDGYNIKGIDELNKKVENDIASFVTTAKQNGNIVNISVNLIFNNNFEPASNWSKLLEVMDAAADFTGMKLLLEKKK
jgi:Domain of Unknown Function with PDB structure (DUF3858)